MEEYGTLSNLLKNLAIGGTGLATGALGTPGSLLSLMIAENAPTNPKASGRLWAVNRAAFPPSDDPNTAVLPGSGSVS